MRHLVFLLSRGILYIYIMNVNILAQQLKTYDISIISIAIAYCHKIPIVVIGSKIVFLT